MAKKKTEPIITHVETLCLAIRCLQADVDKWRAAFRDAGEPDATEEICRLQLEKIEALKQIYRIETGTEY